VAAKNLAELRSSGTDRRPVPTWALLAPFPHGQRYFAAVLAASTSANENASDTFGYSLPEAST